MAREANQSERDELEAVIDRISLSSVIDALAEVADAKAGHISENWQDEELANKWARASLTLGQLARREAIEAVS